MIYVDYRIGSEHLLPLLDKMMLPTQLSEINFGDVAFDGNGPEGKVRIGIELKRIRDLVNSIRSGRLSGHQLPGLTDRDNYHGCMLIVEGEYRPGAQGRLEIKRGYEWVVLEEPACMYSEIDNYLATLEWKVNVRWRRTYSEGETATVIANQYRWWQKQWRDHTAHVQFDDLGFTGPFPIRPMGVVERAVHAILPGVGIQRCLAIGSRFKSVWEMCMADVRDWKQIDGIGDKLANDMVKSIMGEYDARNNRRTR